MFLVSMILLTGVTALTAIYVANRVAYDYELWDSPVSLFSGNLVFGPNYASVLLLLPDYEHALSFLALLTFSSCIAVAVLFYYHVSLVRYGITTNENSKINDKLNAIDVEYDGYLQYLVDNAFEITEKEFGSVKKKMKMKEKQNNKIMGLYERSMLAENAMKLCIKGTMD